MKLLRYEALIIDGLGYVKHIHEKMNVLFHLLADRYERASVLITTHLPFSQWETIFYDPMNATAAVDRLVHHCVSWNSTCPATDFKSHSAARKVLNQHPYKLTSLNTSMIEHSSPRTCLLLSVSGRPTDASDMDTLFFIEASQLAAPPQ